MDILDQYLAAIANQLPNDTRDDIVAELRDTLLSRFEDREEDLGRPLRDEEREAVLHEVGHPIAVAARYRRGPQALVGPELFPYWMFAARAGLAIVAAVSALNVLARIVSGSASLAQAVPQGIASFVGSGLGLIGCITLIGAACEHFGVRPRYLDEWKVKDLGMLRLGEPAQWGASLVAMRTGPVMRSRPGRPTRRDTGSSALGSLVAGVVFVLWWLGVFRFPAIVALGHGSAPTTLLPAQLWSDLYVPILLYALSQIAVDAFGVIRPTAARLRALLQIPVALAGLGLAWIVFRAGEWFTLAGADGTRAVVRGGGTLSGAAWNHLGSSGRALPDLAADLGMILNWVLLAAAIGLAVKIVLSIARAVAAPDRSDRGDRATAQ